MVCLEGASTEVCGANEFVATARMQSERRKRRNIAGDFDILVGKTIKQCSINLLDLDDDVLVRFSINHINVSFRWMMLHLHSCFARLRGFVIQFPWTGWTDFVGVVGVNWVLGFNEN